MKYSILGIMMHSRCNASCDICSVSCSYERNEALEPDKVACLIDSCRDTTIREVSFTGGEPFLEFENLLNYIKCAAKNGLNSSAVTNGFWASNYDKTTETLKILLDSGLKTINVSYDGHHAAYVPKSNIINILNACEELNLPCVLAMTRLKGENVGALIDELSISQNCVKLISSACQPAGRAKERHSTDEFLKKVKPVNMKCAYGGIITVDYYGRVFPCCSHHVFKTPLFVGRYTDMDMPQILYKIKNNSLLYVLRNYGLDPFLNMKAAFRVEPPELVSTPCEVCEMLFSDGVSAYLPDVGDFMSRRANENIQPL